MGSIYDWVAFSLIALLAISSVFVLWPRGWPVWLQSLIFWAVIVRILGCIVRLEVALRFYGTGDAIYYYNAGWRHAQEFRDFDFSAVAEQARWWGTPFIEMLSGLVLTIIGPSIRGESLIFSMLPLVGLLLIGFAFSRDIGATNLRRYLTLLLLWPSLWFWPSSVGKESIVLLALGLVTYGYSGRRGRTGWLMVAAGLALVMGIRPHIAMMVGVALGIADWLAPFQRWNAPRVVRGIALAAAALLTVSASLRQLGLEGADVGGIREFIDLRAGLTGRGGSQIAGTTGLLAIPQAFMNVLLRPFPWEATNPFVLFSSAEVVLLWVLLARRRRTVFASLHNWRESQLLLFVLPLTIVLILFYGAFVSNLGILARQRVVILPFLFIALERAPFSRGRRPTLRRRREAGAMGGGGSNRTSISFAGED